MIFTLEALQAEKGDSLILHFGREESPRFIVIDGGPDPVYSDALKPRLAQLRARWGGEDGGPLDLDMVMVSHIDDDHISGVIQWLEELDETEDSLPFRIQTLWHNSFDNVLGNGSEELRSQLASVAREDPSAFHPEDEVQARHSAAVIASVRQGRALRAHARRLAIEENRGFRGLVMAKDQGDTFVSIGDGLRLHVLCPSRERLAALHAEWERDVRKHPGDTARAASFADRSVANLSSIVVVAEMGTGLAARRMLLTGDARGDHILEGLRRASLLVEGKAHFDVLKLPHHGSNRNLTLGFLECVTADHYVISANGEHDNPDRELFEWLAQARGDAAYAIHLTNEHLREPRKNIDVEQVVKAALAAHPRPNRRVVYRDEGALSLKVDLLGPVGY